MQAGAKLVVLNLSQQTDSSDLLGGFRPVQPRDALLPLLARLQARPRVLGFWPKACAVVRLMQVAEAVWGFAVVRA